MKRDDVVSLLEEGFFVALKETAPENIVAAKILTLIYKLSNFDRDLLFEYVYDCIEPALSDCETIFPPKEEILDHHCQSCPFKLILKETISQ